MLAWEGYPTLGLPCRLESQPSRNWAEAEALEEEGGEWAADVGVTRLVGVMVTRAAGAGQARGLTMSLRVLQAG